MNVRDYVEAWLTFHGPHKNDHIIRITVTASMTHRFVTLLEMKETLHSNGARSAAQFLWTLAPNLGTEILFSYVTPCVINFLVSLFQLRGGISELQRAHLAWDGPVIEEIETLNQRWFLFESRLVNACMRSNISFQWWVILNVNRKRFFGFFIWVRCKTSFRAKRLSCDSRPWKGQSQA